MADSFQKPTEVMETLKSDEDYKKLHQEVEKIHETAFFCFQALWDLRDKFIRDCIQIKIELLKPDEFELLRPLAQQFKEYIQNFLRDENVFSDKDGWRKVRSWVEQVLEDLEETNDILNQCFRKE